MLLVWLDTRGTRKSWQLDDDSIVDRTQRDFRIVIYLAGGVPSLQQDLCSYANRYFIPVYENKDRGWRVRWFSRGKFNEGHSGSCRRTGYKSYRWYERFSLSFADRDRHLRTVLLAAHSLSFFRLQFISLDDSPWRPNEWLASVSVRKSNYHEDMTLPIVILNKDPKKWIAVLINFTAISLSSLMDI